MLAGELAWVMWGGGGEPGPRCCFSEAQEQAAVPPPGLLSTYGTVCRAFAPYFSGGRGVDEWRGAGRGSELPTRATTGDVASLRCDREVAAGGEGQRGGSASISDSPVKARWWVGLAHVWVQPRGSGLARGSKSVTGSGG